MFGALHIMTELLPSSRIQGGFRMLRNKEVAGKIIAYDQFNNDAVKNIFLFHSKFYENATPLRSKVLDENIITEIYKVYENTPGTIFSKSLDRQYDQEKVTYHCPLKFKLPRCLNSEIR
jgi:hypothetical protein